MFTGFSDDLFGFYRELRENNSSEWWYDSGKWTYRDVILPMIGEFLVELDPRWLPMTVYKPHNNVRFRPGMDPLKEHLGALGSDIDGVHHYLHIEADRVFVSRGMYAMSDDQLARFRTAIDDDVLGAGFQDAYDLAVEAGYANGSWDTVVTAPRGFPRDHVRIDLLRKGGVTMGVEWPSDHGWLHTRRALSMIQDGWSGVDDLCEWLTRHVSPPEL